ncbi:MAG: ADP-dependent NAD(P)H-hydrate dehydratase / NAD(P)H-hydrate epimerase [Actinomycetota bacterium]|nr:ADP-dependent NAD(P)H-hydrate dehydratase / NAD(P)H-hydrate epimerase [Actinomycetota bacterium]
MRPLLTPEEMRSADEATISSGTSGEVLMERAGRAVARAVVDLAGGRYGKRVTVVCGKGNNGGDGFVAARVLHIAGLTVVCCPLVDPDALEGASKLHFERLVAVGCRVSSFSDRLMDCDVVVDAIFGTGFKGSVESPFREAIDSINESGASVLAIDIPSGVNGATGSAGPHAIKADVTVCIAVEKIGTAFAPGLDHAGHVEVVDIGIATRDATALLIEAEDVAGWLPKRLPDAHKKSSGVIAIMAGSDEMPGAAVLTSRAALRAGAGYVRLGCVEAVRAAASSAPELLVRVVADESFDESSVTRFKDALDGAQAVATGPGIGTGDAQRSFIESLMSSYEGPMVLDADALNVLADDTGVLERRASKGPVVITPHPGELGRLLDRDSKAIQADRLGAVTEASHRFGCTVLLKGRRTLIASPGSPVLVNPTGGPELAVGGSGDVLTGIVGTYLAAGLAPREAAGAAAYVHGLAGSLVRGRSGVPQGVLPSDVIEALPEAIALVAALPWEP